MAATRNRSVAIVTIGSLLQMVVQFLLQLILARQFGAGSDMDAYVAGATIPLVVGGIISVPLGGVLIPALSRAAAEDSQPAAMRLAGQTAIVVTAVTLLLAALICWQARGIVRFVYPGLAETDAALSAGLLGVLAWLIPANALTTFCQSFQNWQGRFLLPALAGVVGPAVTVLIVVQYAAQWGIAAVAWGMLAGGVINVVVQLPGMRGIHWGSPSSHQMRRLLLMMGPLLLASIYIRLDPLVDRSLASSLEEGVISQLGYTSRIVNAILALTSGALSVVAFPYLAAAAAKGRTELAAEISRTLGMLAMVVVPFVAATLLFAPGIVHDLFQRGQFTASDTAAVALLLRWSAGLIVGASVGEITSRAFYADHSMWPPVVMGAVVLTLAIAAKVLLTPVYGAVALVGSSSVAYLLSAIVLLIWLRVRLGEQIFAGLPGALFVSCTCALLACLAGGVVYRLPIPLPAVWGGLIGGATFAVAAVLFPRRMSRQLGDTLRNRIARGR